MNMRIKLLIVFVSMLTLIFAINLGVASADHPGQGNTWDCSEPQGGDVSCAPEDRTATSPAADNTLAPVGQHIVPEDAPGHPGAVNGFGNLNSNAAVAIINNPLCPFHDVTQ